MLLEIVDEELASRGLSYTFGRQPVRVYYGSWEGLKRQGVGIRGQINGLDSDCDTKYNNGFICSGK